MKKFSSAFLSVILFLTFSVINSNSQWQPDVRLTNESAPSNTSQNNAWCIAANGNVVHIVWADGRENFLGSSKIFYNQSTDGGTTWEGDTRLTDFHGYNPSISVSGLIVHIVWNELRDYNKEIYYKRSTDGGISWGADDTRLTNDPGDSFYPSLAASGSYVHTVWMETRDGNREIYLKRSTNSGLTWGTDTRLTNNYLLSQFPSIAVSGSNVHIVWFDTRPGNHEIYYKRSIDDGTSWGADIRLTNNIYNSFYPTIAASGSNVYVVWQDDREHPEHWNLFFKKSSDGGLNWGADTRLTNNLSSSITPSIAASGTNVHVIWNENGILGYKISTDAGITWGAETSLTNTPVYTPSLSVYGTAVHVVWSGNHHGNYEIYYKRNPTGNPIGIIQIGNEVPEKFSLGQNYPNPFNPTTNFEFRIAEFGFVNLTIYDAMGREVTTLVNENLKPGTYKVEWSADFRAANFSSGVYFYKITAGNFTETKRMILIK